MCVDVGGIDSRNVNFFSIRKVFFFKSYDFLLKRTFIFSYQNFLGQRVV